MIWIIEWRQSPKHVWKPRTMCLTKAQARWELPMWAECKGGHWRIAKYERVGRLNRC